MPLIVLTADRPPELRDIGAGQAIDQLKLYGSAAKWFVEVGNHEPGRDAAVHHRALACRAWATAARRAARARAPELPAARAARAGRRGARRRRLGGPRRRASPGSSWAQPERARADGSQAWPRSPAARAARSSAGRRTGTWPSRSRGSPRATGWPILAEPTSGLRCGAHDRSHVIAHYDVLLRDEAWPRAAARARDARRRHARPRSRCAPGWRRTGRSCSTPTSTWHEPTRARRAGPRRPPRPRAATRWRRAGDAPSPSEPRLARARGAPPTRWSPAALAAAPDPFEPKMWAALGRRCRTPRSCGVSSSMPIRDVETFFPAVANPIRFLANRGANGIDGVVSSAAGAALAAGGRALLLTGELALLHDIGGLLAAARRRRRADRRVREQRRRQHLRLPPVAEHGAADVRGARGHAERRRPGAVAALAGMEHRMATTPARCARRPRSRAWSRSAPTAPTTSASTGRWSSGWAQALGPSAG